MRWQEKAPKGMHFAEAFVIPGPNIAVRMTLAEGHRFVVFAEGERPCIVPITEPGSYEIDAAALKPTMKWPILIVVVQKKHAKLFAKMTAETAAGIAAQAGRVAREAMN